MTETVQTSREAASKEVAPRAMTATFDDHFIRFLMRHERLPTGTAAIIKKLCQAVRSHHSCLPLDDIDAGLIDSLLATSIATSVTTPATASATTPATTSVTTSITRKAGEADENAPLILANNKLYLHRHYVTEKSVADKLIERNKPLHSDAKLVARYLKEHFPADGEPDFQKLAVFQAVNRQVTIITGGPGTGKTWVVHKVIELLKAANPDLRVLLAAPTGKAAMRLGNSFAETPTVFTLHRLLGMRPDGGRARHDETNPIAADVLVVDEASMIDLDMMARVLAALPPDARLILLGDPHQLPSVDTGNVLADICAADPEYSQAFCELAKDVMGDLMADLMKLPAAPQPNRLADALCRLEKSHRFEADSSIGQLAADIKAGTARAATSPDGAIRVQELHELYDLGQEAAGDLLGNWQEYLALLRQGLNIKQNGKQGTKQGAGQAHEQAHEQTHEQAHEQELGQFANALMQAFAACRILCSHRNGFPGVNALNEAILHELEHLGLKKPGDLYFQGRPIMITRNDYNLRLFNGDTGICVKMPNGSYRVAFPDNEGQVHLYPPSRLPAHETCYAMTVHKAQGSEFDQVIFMLSDAESEELDELITRELIYTAVTRARQSVTLYCRSDRWDAGMANSAARKSGMAEYLNYHEDGTA